MFKRLRLRLTVVCSVVTSVILIGMACASLALSVQQLRQRGQVAFPSDLNAVMFHLRGQTTLDHAWLSQTEAGSGLILYVEDNGHPLRYAGTEDAALRARLLEEIRAIAAGQYGLDISQPPDSRMLSNSTAFSYADPVTGQRYYAGAAVVPSSGGWLGLLVLKSLRPEEEQIARLGWMFGGVTLLACGLLWLFAWVFTARAIRPVEESRLRQMEFVSAASHELRSPLAVIRASLSAMRDAPPDRQRRFSDAIDGEVQRLSRLVSDLLALASADSGSWPVHREPADLETLLLDTSESFEPMANSKGIHLSVQLPDEPLPLCRCDRNRIAQVLASLVDNALSYTPEGGRVTLSAQPHRSGALLVVRDTGPGVPDEHKEKIFRRFYRADPARSKREHYGLGLCIAQEIVALHRGGLSVADAPGGGAMFQVYLPNE